MAKLIVFLTLLAMPVAIIAATIHVPADQPTIQAGIDASLTGDTVLVSPGTYVEHLTYPTRRVRVQSASGAQQTILKGSVSIGESDSGSVFQGFRITGFNGYDIIHAANGITRFFEVRDNVIVDNEVTDVFRGGDNASLIIEGNVIAESSAGGNIIVATGAKCRFVNNTVYGGWRGLAIYGANSVIENNIVVNITNYAIYNPHATSIVDYNDFWNNGSGNSPGVHGISANPLFTNPGGFNFALQPASPCIDTGDPNPIYNDPDGTRNDMGAVVFLAVPQALNINYDPGADGDTVHTRLPTVSWDYVGPLDQHQLQVQVGTDTLWDAVEIWDSGPITAPDMSIQYIGPPLSNHSSYWVRVRVADIYRWGPWTQEPLVVKITLARVPEHYSAIQAAINEAADSDTILVSDGHYYERLNLLEKSLLIASKIMLDGDTSHIANTIIDADTSVLGVSDTGSVILAWSDAYQQYQSVEIHGFTLTGGTGGASGCIKAWLPEMKISNCIITGNSGVAEFNSGTGLTFDSCAVNNCPAGVNSGVTTFSNRCTFVDCELGTIPMTFGGTLFEFDRCVADSCQVAAVGQLDHHFTIDNCMMDECYLFAGPGGWMEIDDSEVRHSRLPVQHGILDIDNTVVTGTIVMWGSIGYDLSLTGSSFAGSVLLDAFKEESGLQSESRGGSITLVNSILTTTEPILFECDDEHVYHINANCCDIVSGTGIWVSASPPSTIDTSDVTTLDPAFCDTAANDFHLSDISPCLPENNGCGVLIGALGLGCTTGRPEAHNLNLGTEIQTHVVDQTPVFFWSYSDTLATSQQMFEIEVGSDSDWTVAEMWAPGEIASQDTSTSYSGSSLVDGAQYYLRVRVNNGLRWGSWTEGAFHMNSVPSAVECVDPVNEGNVEYNPPTVTVLSVDAEGDSLRFTVQIAVDSTFFFPLVARGTGDSGSPTHITAGSALEENRRYWMRAKANDGFEETGWSTPSKFYVNAINEAPSAFSLAMPGSASGLNVYENRPQFFWHHSPDPDPHDSVTYTLTVAIDSMFVFETTTEGITDTSFTITYDLQWGRDYWWRVGAVDLGGALTWSSQSFRFHTFFWECGDANGSGGNPSVDIDDIVFLIQFIFAAGPSPEPIAAGDANCSGGDPAIDIDDVVYLINYVFGGGPAPCAECR